MMAALRRSNFGDIAAGGGCVRSESRENSACVSVALLLRTITTVRSAFPPNSERNRTVGFRSNVQQKKSNKIRTKRNLRKLKEKRPPMKTREHPGFRAFALSVNADKNCLIEALAVLVMAHGRIDQKRVRRLCCLTTDKQVEGSLETDY